MTDSKVPHRDVRCRHGLCVRGLRRLRAKGPIPFHRHYVYNFLGIKPEQEFVSEELTPGKHALGMEFVRESAGDYGEFHGTTTLYVDDRGAAKGRMRAQVGKFTLSGDGLCVGYDSGDNVSSQYQAPGTFTGGTILGVGIDVSDEVYLDLEKEAAAAFARD